MAFTTKASRLIYKIFPSASSANPDTLFSTADGWSTVTTSSYSQSFLNFPDDYNFGFANLVGTVTYPTTRVTSSTYPTISRALPWGSMASDFLWNCSTPSWSYETTNGYHTWSYSQVSESFNYRYNKNGSAYGVRSYSITSSWQTYNYKLYASASNIPVTFSFQAGQTSTYPTPNISNYTYALEYPAGEYSPTENVFFDQSGGMGITRADVSKSISSQSLGATNIIKFEGLKKRRLFFPVPYSGSGTTRGTDYWFRANTGVLASDMFDENGGVYNVSFTLRKSAYTDMFPDDETFMSVFIYNVKDVVTSGSYYPPANNIVKIGNNIVSSGTPPISFLNPATNEIQTTFTIQLIQYGYPAQLCFEPSGSSATDKYFGIIIDDISICKTGVTTDPKFIAPSTTAGTISSPYNADSNSTGPAIL
jgi:hypothetical protein